MLLVRRRQQLNCCSYVKNQNKYVVWHRRGKIKPIQGVDSDQLGAILASGQDGLCYAVPDNPNTKDM